MFKLFTSHPKSRDQSYFTHLKFASLMGLRLAASAVCFLVHAVFPFIPIPERFNCHDMVHALADIAGWRK